MNDLSPKARALFAKARDDGAPSKAEREALYEKLEAAIATGAPPLSPGVAPRGPWMSLSVVVGLAVAGLVWLAMDDAPHARPAATEHSFAHQENESTPAQRVKPQAEELVVPSSLAPPRRRAPGASLRGAAARRRVPERPGVAGGTDAAAPPIPEDDDASALAMELALLRAAQRARGANRYDVALAALEEHLARFPSGVLTHERDVTRALVLCERGGPGDLEHGRALAARFARSAWSPALATACGTDANRAPSP